MQKNFLIKILLLKTKYEYRISMKIKRLIYAYFRNKNLKKFYSKIRGVFDKKR
jgi:hypothetical protein